MGFILLVFKKTKGIVKMQNLISYNIRDLETHILTSFKRSDEKEVQIIFNKEIPYKKILDFMQEQTKKGYSSFLFPSKNNYTLTVRR
tara:strand:- start:160 stop:420 length:261 start_codon:yes stop_codon:yes gene_type:complete